LKIAITGHTAGIGQALAQAYTSRGHDIVGFSRREGNNIRNTPKICDQIEPCDVFVNNAQAGFAQTELLFEMAQRWTNTGKHIIVISTQMTNYPVSNLPGLDMDQYWLQKTTLEQAVKQLRNRNLKIRFTVVRPGDVATSKDKTVPPSADPNVWANTLLQTFDMVYAHNLNISDISLGPV
jgi:NADP-dependent 3-hydroxy acid dehydrogenase YdfG